MSRWALACALVVGCDGSAARPTVEAVRAAARPSETSEKPLELRSAARSRVVAAGLGFGVAIVGGEMFVWGDPRTLPVHGDLRGSVTSMDPPIPPSRVDVPARPTAVVAGQLDGGDRHICVLSEQGEVYCWGKVEARGRCRPAPWRRVTLPAPALEIAALGLASCARLVGGSIACWGDAAGDLEQAPPTCAPRLIETSEGTPLQGMIRMEVGAAIDAEGTVYAWGNDACGQVSASSTASPTVSTGFVARPVPGVPAAIDVATTGTTSCVLTRLGEVVCWGDLHMHSLKSVVALGWCFGQGGPPTPIALPPATLLACADSACAALGRDGLLYSWGAFLRPSAQPVQGVRAIAPGAFGGCCAGESVSCWAGALVGIRDLSGDDLPFDATPYRVLIPAGADRDPDE